MVLARSRKKSFRHEERETSVPLAVKKLYPDSEVSPDELSMVTDTPPHMIMSMVRMEVVSESLNPVRKKSLMRVWMDAYDRRMISKSGNGRRQFIQIMDQQARSADDILTLG